MYDRFFNFLLGLTCAMAFAIGFMIPELFTGEAPAELVKLKTDITVPEVEAPDVSLAFEIKANRTIAKAKIDSAISLMAKLDELEPEAIALEYVGKFYLTMYAATAEQCGNSLGITASGRKVTEDPTCHTVAVDPSVIPLGTYLIIEGYPGIVFRADDTGSAINGYDIDIFTTSESESKTFNNVSGAKVWIIKD